MFRMYEYVRLTLLGRVTKKLGHSQEKDTTLSFVTGVAGEAAQQPPLWQQLPLQRSAQERPFF